MENNNQNYEQNYQPTPQEQQYGYQQDVHYDPNQYIFNEPQAPVMSVKDWVLTMLVMLIPCVNIILMFVWAFSKTENPNKSNFFKAYLIYAAISVVISIIFGIVYGVIIGAAVSNGAIM